MAIDLLGIDYLAENTVPPFSNWTPESGASVLSSEATLPSNGYVYYNLNSEIGNGTSASAYRKLTFKIYNSNIKNDIESNYKSNNQLIILFNALYATTTSGEVMNESILSVINTEDIISETEEYIEVSKVFPTWNKAIQNGSINILNKTNNTLTLSDILVLRSADVSNEQAAQILNNILDASEPSLFKIYRLSNIINGMGFVIPSGREVKWAPIRQGNDVVEIDTNYREAIPAIYIEGQIDLSTDINDNTEGT